MSDRPPEVSVLLPCRDVGPWLPECIASLEGQSLQSVEILAVNDDSADDTGDILRRWSARDSRVRLLEATGCGLVHALNLAAAAARAPLLARMDGDDVAEPLRLERQRDFMAYRRDLAACGTGVELFPRTAVGGGYERYENWLNGLTDPRDLDRDLFVECPLAHPSLMIRRSALSALGGYRDVGWPEDYDLVLRLFAAGMRAANLDERLMRWRVRPHRHSLTSDRYSPREFRRCKVHFLGETFLPAGRGLVVWGAGKVGKPLARELIGQGMPVMAFVDLDRRKVGQEIHGAPVLDPGGFESLLRKADPYVLAAVGSPGASEEIRDALDAMGLREIADYRMCA